MLLITLALLALGLGRSFLAASTNSVAYVPGFLSGFSTVLVLVQTVLLYSYLLNRLTEGKVGPAYRDLPSLIVLSLAVARVLVDYFVGTEQPWALFLATQTMGCFYAAVLVATSLGIRRLTKPKQVQVKEIETKEDLPAHVFREA